MSVETEENKPLSVSMDISIEEFPELTALLYAGVKFNRINDADYEAPESAIEWFQYAKNLADEQVIDLTI